MIRGMCEWMSRRMMDKTWDERDDVEGDVFSMQG